MMDDDKVDLNLIAALIRYIVLEEEVSFVLFCFVSSGSVILILFSYQGHVKRKNSLKCF